MNIENNDLILDSLIELSQMLKKDLSIEDIKAFKMCLKEGLSIEEAQSQIIVMNL